MARIKQTPRRLLSRHHARLATRQMGAPSTDPPVRCVDALTREDCLHLQVAREAYADSPAVALGDGELILARSTPTLKFYRRAGTNDYIIGSRGTAEGQDVLTDATLAAGALKLSRRWRKDRAVVQAFLATTPSARARVAGHSLGGAIARELSREFGDHVRGGVTFNSAFDATQLADARPGITNYFTRGDALGKLAHVAGTLGHNNVYIGKGDWNFLRAHKLEQFVEDAGR